MDFVLERAIQTSDHRVQKEIERLRQMNSQLYSDYTLANNKLQDIELENQILKGEIEYWKTQLAIEQEK
jgi:FtsZ-binding cell division protein ZapB